jgi:uncharacterized protein YdhG (YjbR/CyaY superfamily)
MQFQKTVDDYIAAFAPDIQDILEKMRQTVKAAAPEAEETISYRMPAYKWSDVLVYFAAFKKHIGLFPPARRDANLVRAVKPFAGSKWNLQFLFENPIPYALMRRIVKARVSATRKSTDSKRRAI